MPARPSAGCGTSTAVPGERELHLTSGGVDRSYFEHVPPAHNGTDPLPLVLDFHGYAEGATLHKMTSKLGDFGDTHGFITVTPAGTSKPPRWDLSLTGIDLPFVRELLDELDHTLCVDDRRVYAAGYSNGAMFSSTIACAMADRVAAIAPIAGVINPPACAPSRPIPLVAFHGTADPVVSYDGGIGEGLKNIPAPDGSGRTLGQVTSNLPTFGRIPDNVATWAQLDGCGSAPPTETTVTADVTKLAFACPSGDDFVELYRVEGGGHSWPGSAFTASIASIVGPTTMTIDADTIMWEFFEDHPLPS